MVWEELSSQSRDPHPRVRHPCREAIFFAESRKQSRFEHNGG